MARFFEQGEPAEYYFEEDETVVKLDNNNFFANIHEVMNMDMTVSATPDHVYDRVAVQDPEDEEWWVYWKYDMGAEEFAKLEFIARRCGSMLVRQEVLPSVQSLFEAAHSFDDDDFNHLLEAGDGS